MKKNLLFVALMSCITVFTSCSGEDLMSENLTAEKAEDLITVEAPVTTTVASTEGQGSVRRWRLSDGQIVTAHHESNGIELNEIKLVSIDETPKDENTVNVCVTVSSRSAANTITKSVSYAKMVKEVAPTPAEPTIIREFFAADTTLTVKKYDNASLTVTATLQHTLYKVTEWSDGRNDSIQIWNKDFLVAKTYLSANEGKIYSRTAAADLKYSAKIDWSDSSEEKNGAFTITKRNGPLRFFADYVCDANYAQQWDGRIKAEEATVEVAYEGYNATYDFHLAVDFIDQKEENRGLENEIRSNYEYVYEATSVGNFNVSLNGVSLGTHKVDIDVLRYYPETAE